MSGDVIFTCVAAATTVHCEINGSSNTPPDIDCKVTQTADGHKNMTVVVPALKKYNNTLVQCCLYNRSAQFWFCSKPAVLIIEDDVTPTETKQASSIYPEASSVPSPSVTPSVTPLTTTTDPEPFHLGATVATVTFIVIAVIVAIVTVVAVVAVILTRRDCKRVSNMQHTTDLFISIT